MFAVLLGFGSGLKSIVQGTLPLALFGSGAYGARLGVMALARQVFSAVAPFVLAALIGSVGPAYALASLVASRAFSASCWVDRGIPPLPERRVKPTCGKSDRAGGGPGGRGLAASYLNR